MPQAAADYANLISVEMVTEGANIRLGDHRTRFMPEFITSAGVIYKIQVPRRFNVDARIRTGRVAVTGIDGDFRFCGSGSPIADSIGGRVDVDSSGGFTLLENLKSSQPVWVRQSGGFLRLLNIVAPLDVSFGRGYLFVDLRKGIPESLKIEGSAIGSIILPATNTANVVLDLAAAEGVSVPDAHGGPVVRGHAVKVDATGKPVTTEGAGSRHLKISMARGRISVWPDARITVVPEGNTSQASPQTQQAKILESADRAGAIRWTFKTDNCVMYPPAIGPDGTVYITGDHSLYAMTQDGQRKWTVNSEGGFSQPAAIGRNGSIYVPASWSGGLYALDGNGSSRWPVGKVATTSTAAIGRDGTLYTTNRRSLQAVAPDGTIRWRFQAGDPFAGPPAIATDGTLYAGSRDDRLYALSPDGHEKWAFGHARRDLGHTRDRR